MAAERCEHAETECQEEQQRQGTHLEVIAVKLAEKHQGLNVLDQPVLIDGVLPRIHAPNH